MTDQLRAILVDLDGTLLDSLPALRGVYRSFLEDRGREPSDEEFDRWNGPPLRDIVCGLSASHRIEEPLAHLVTEYVQRVEDAYLHAPLAQGGRELVEWAARESVLLALVTSSGTWLATQTIARHGLREYFAAIVGGDLVDVGKPAPDIYLAALERVAVQPLAAVAVEDSPNGVRSARSAGLRCVGVAKDPDVRLALRFAGASVDARDLREVVKICDSLRVGAGRAVPAARVVGVVVGAREFSHSDETMAARAWKDETCVRPDIVDGQVLAARSWECDGSVIDVTCDQVRYRHFVAQRRGLSLGLSTIGVSGVTLVRTERTTEVLLGRRASTVTQYPMHWELVPSGGLSGDHTSDDGSVDFVRQVTDELLEESGIGEDAIRDVGYLGLLEDLDEQVLDIAIKIELRKDGFARLREAPRDEYVELVAVPLQDVLAFITARGAAVPTVEGLLRLLALRDRGAQQDLEPRELR